MPGPPPLYGTWSVSIPARILKKVPSTWLLPATAGCRAYVSEPGFALAAAIRSFTDLSGELVVDHNSLAGVRTTSEIGAKSLSVS
jgi:hypothetical protein